jgi:hypothetical protein
MSRRARLASAPFLGQTVMKIDESFTYLKIRALARAAFQLTYIRLAATSLLRDGALSEPCAL